LFDEQFSVEKLSEMGNPLDKLSTAINFELFRQVLESKLLNTAKKNNAGAKPFDVVFMFKILILQRYYGLGDIQETLGVSEPHNITYAIFAELGLIGGFLLLITSLFKDAYENIKNSSDQINKIISVSLFSSLFGYLLFYQFYDGALYDAKLMLNISLIICHKNILSGREPYNLLTAT
tara:strand:+ start:699 stop:1232 length:534 start_codon:yes stop_codon:yes gene_type:complete